MSERVQQLKQQILQAINFEDYEYLSGSKEIREKQKELFLTGEVEYPTLNYPKINVVDLERKLVQIQSLSEEVDAILENSDRQSAKAVLGEKMLAVRMLIAAGQGDTKLFAEYAVEIYGSYSQEAYTIDLQELSYVLCQAERKGLAEKEIAFLRQNILDIPENKNCTPLMPRPHQDTFHNMQKFIVEYKKDLLQNMSIAEREYQCDEIKELMQQALKNVDARDWSVEIVTDGRASISTDQESKKILIPEKRSMQGSYLEKIILHEIGCHVVRRTRGQQHDNFLMGIGLDRYMVADEGLAMVFEQSLEDSFTAYASFDKHLAMSLAMGADGKKRAFKETYEIYCALGILEACLANSRNLNREEIEEQKGGAYNACVRIFRGTDCKTPGAVYPKDLAYREGNVAVWDFIEQNPDYDLNNLLIGKYDPTRPDHRQIALG